MTMSWWGEGPCPEPKQGPAVPTIAGAMDAGDRHHGARVALLQLF